MKKTIIATATEKNTFYPYYKIVGWEDITKELKKSIPLTTGYSSLDFPSYLKEFKHCYKKVGIGYQLKDEYINNRPTYSTKVNYREYKLEIDDKSLEQVKKRQIRWGNCAERYAALFDKYINAEDIG